MADVTRVKLTGRPRPLGLLKDEVMYFDIANRHRTFKRKDLLQHDIYRAGRQITHEMKGALHQAALINIVAAVNERYSGEPVKKLEHLHAPNVDSMTVLSTLMSQKDRTISIPRPQIYTHFPHKLIQRKPVYYKHSDEEVKRDNAFLFNRSATSFQLKSRVREKLKSGSSEPLIKISSVSTSKDGIKSENSVIIRNPLTDSSNFRPKIAGRKHGAQSRHSESRKYREISKCDAIDIMDATDAIKRDTMAPSASPGMNSDANNLNHNPFPFYRTKSLPSIFSPRRNKSGSAKHRHKTPASTSGQQQLPSPRQIVQSGNEIPRGVYGRPVITSREAANEDTPRPISRSSRDINSTVVSPQLCSFVDSENQPTTSPVRPVEAEVHLLGIASRSLKSDDPATANDLQRSISNENGGETTSELSFIESRFAVSAKSQKSIIVNRQGKTEGASGKRTPFKKVKFASVDDNVDNKSENDLDTRMLDNTHNEILHKQHHKQVQKYKIGFSDLRSENSYFQSSFGEPQPTTDLTRSQSRQSGTSTQSNSGSFKPMTMNELDRLKQKFIPNDLRSSLSSQQSFYLYDDIKISKLKTKEIKATKKENDIKTEEEKEVDRIDTKTNSGSKLPETNEATENTKENCDFRNEQEEMQEKEKNDETKVYSCADKADNPTFFERQIDKKEESIYQLMQAFENDPYSDFEHNKIRKKHQNSYYDKSENKAPFVKVKLDN